MVVRKKAVSCPKCAENFIVNVTPVDYDYKEMYVDHLRGNFSLKKFIESFGRDEIRKAIYND